MCRRATSAWPRRARTSPITTVTEGGRMTAIVIDGKAVAAAERARTSEQARAFRARHGRPPGLAVVQVGEDPASTVYVRNKRRSSLEAGIESFAHDLPPSASEAEILALVDSLNRDE